MSNPSTTRTDQPRVPRFSRLELKVPTSQKAKLQAIANSEGIGKSEVVRRVLSDYFRRERRRVRDELRRLEAQFDTDREAAQWHS